MSETLADFRPAILNANAHTEYGTALLDQAMHEDGYVAPMTSAADGEILDGSNRLEKAADVFAGIAPLVVHHDGKRPIIMVRDDIPNAQTPEAQRIALRANRIAQVDLKWNADVIAAFNAATPEVAAAVFDQATLNELIAEAQGEQEPADAEPQIDKGELLNEFWKVKRDDLFLIGEHRLLCADSTDRARVERVMNGEKAELLFTSPPYADMREYAGGDMSPKYLAQFIPAWKESAQYQVVNLGIKREQDEVIEYWNEYIKAARNCGYKLLSWNIWDKNEAGGPSNQMAMFAIEHEFLFVFGEAVKEITRTEPKKHTETQTPKLRRQPDGSLKRSSAGENYKFKNAPTIFRTKSTEHGAMRKYHPAVMIVDLPLLYIEVMTNDLDIVADAFAGSGTTLVASETLSRRCRAIEISPAYCAVILDRMSRAFPHLKIERA